MSNQKESNKNITLWIQILFSGVILIGFLYAVILHGFAGNSLETQFHNAAYTNAVKATVEIIPIRSPQAIANGEKTYKTVCAACHGQNMEGTVGPNLKDATWLHGINTETALVRLVSQGVSQADAKGPNKIAMPAKGGAKLSGEQVWEVIYYIGSKNTSVTKDSPAK
jgi:cytochrome c oxidase cbb3-type subunit 3